MNPVEELEAVLTLDQAHELGGLDSSGSSTQQLLDDLLGRFEEDDSPLFLALGPTSDFCADSDE